VGDVEGRICLLTDDLTTTAGTLTAAASLLKKEGAKKVYAAVTHCLLGSVGRARLMDSCIDELVVTNSIPVTDNCNGKIKVVSIAKLLSEGITRIHEGTSVSSLFKIHDK
jgi:ribose-phosphate pyrophosphokinase